jgi:hypothetical protein
VKGRERFKAGVYVSNRKQFEGTVPDLDRTCYRGKAKEAARLINLAMELGAWEGDEVFFGKARAVRSRKKASLMIAIFDGPNEERWEDSISKCK